MSVAIRVLEHLEPELEVMTAALVGQIMRQLRLELRLLAIGDTAAHVAWQINNLPGLRSQEWEFREHGFEVSVELDPRTANEALRSTHVDIVLVDAGFAAKAIGIARRLSLECSGKHGEGPMLSVAIYLYVMAVGFVLAGVLASFV